MSSQGFGLPEGWFWYLELITKTFNNQKNSKNLPNLFNVINSIHFFLEVISAELKRKIFLKVGKEKQ